MAENEMDSPVHVSEGKDSVAPLKCKENNYKSLDDPGSPITPVNKDSGRSRGFSVTDWIRHGILGDRCDKVSPKENDSVSPGKKRKLKSPRLSALFKKSVSPVSVAASSEVYRFSPVNQGNDENVSSPTSDNSSLKTNETAPFSDTVKKAHLAPVWTTNSPYRQELCRLMTGTANCRYADYNINTWAEDILSLPHNAVRCELMDMYSMFDAVVRLEEKLTFGDAYKMTKWMRLFVGFLKALFSHEIESFFPAVLETKNSNPSIEETTCHFLVQQKRIEGEVTATMELFNELSSMVCKESSTSGEVAEMMTGAIRAATKLGSHLIECYGSQELYIPAALYKHYPNGSLKAQLHSKLVHDLMKSEAAKINTITLTRWMRTKEELKEFLKNYAPPSLRPQYARWQKKFHYRHRKIVEDLVAKSKT